MSVSLDLQNMANIDFQYWIYKNKCISGKKKNLKIYPGHLEKDFTDLPCIMRFIYIKPNWSKRLACARRN